MKIERKAHEYALYIFVDEEAEKVLMQHRQEPFFEGKLIFPGGSIEPGELPLEAFIRESKEETEREPEYGILLEAIEIFDERWMRYHPVLEVVNVDAVKVEADDRGNVFEWIDYGSVSNKMFRNSAPVWAAVLRELGSSLEVGYVSV